MTLKSMAFQPLPCGFPGCEGCNTQARFDKTPPFRVPTPPNDADDRPVFGRSDDNGPVRDEDRVDDFDPDDYR